MKIVRIFNNNVVLTVDSGTEYIVQGSGIGFGKKVGEIIDITKIEKRFKFQKTDRSKFDQMIDEVPIEYFIMVETFLHRVSVELNSDTLINCLLGLVDHIYFAVERAKQGIKIPYLLSDEISLIYQDEFKLGLELIEIVYDESGIRLDRNEACYIAMHLITARGNLRNNETKIMLDVIQNIKDIIMVNFDIKDFSEFKCQRLLTHIKFLAERIVSKQKTELSDVDELYDLLSLKDVKIEKTIREIKFLLNEKYNFEFLKQEQTYLMVHLLKLI